MRLPCFLTISFDFRVEGGVIGKMSSALLFLFLIFKIGATFQFDNPSIYEKPELKDNAAENSLPLLLAKDDLKSDKTIDYSRLDVRVGKLITVQEIVTNPIFYVVEVEVAEPITRTVVTALVDHYPEPELLENKTVVVVCNVRPRRTNGFDSEAVLFCAKDGNKTEILEPPAGCTPGEKVTVEGYNSTANKFLKLRHYIFESVVPDFKVNGEGIATYKGVALEVADKGFVRTKSLKNVGILEAKD